MAIADKKILLTSLETELGSLLTVTQLSSAMRLISEQLDSYSVECTSVPDQAGIDLLDAFIGAKKVEGRSEKTLTRYKYIMDRMLESVHVPLSRITVYHLRDYLAKEKGRGISENTLEGYREVFSAVFGWLAKENLIQTNPCTNLNAIKVPKKVRTPYTDVDMEIIKEGCENARDKAIVFFLRATGCRISEVCALNRADVDLQKRECTVTGKGDKERTVYFDTVTAMILQKYLDGRDDDDPALFISRKRRKRLDPNAVRFILKEIEARSGGTLTNVHPHRFRRTLATGLINSGMPIQDVAAILGHEKLDTTMKYIYQSKDSIKNAYQRFA